MAHIPRVTKPTPHIARRPIPLAHLDPDAVKVVRRLVRYDYLAYFVGGCVRDLLLGCLPKDFDLSTSARPPELKKLFRNCRIIGRRFRLGHILFREGKIIEVATFRRDPEEANGNDDLLVRRDNVFGEPHEDALRRDFTINALFYDLSKKRIIDYAGGLEDIERRLLRTIGDPNIRLQEDPVRILRAIKFTARQDLGMDPALYEASIRFRRLLARSAPARVFEEILRLLRGGAAHRSIWLAYEMGILGELMPEVADFIDRGDRHSRELFLSLQAVDAMARVKRLPSDAVLVTALLHKPIELHLGSRSRDRGRIIQETLQPIAERLVVPKRMREQMRRILIAQSRFDGTARRKRGEIPLDAIDFREITLRIEGRETDFLQSYRNRIVPKSKPSRKGLPRRRKPRRQRM